MLLSKCLYSLLIIFWKLYWMFNTFTNAVCRLHISCMKTICMSCMVWMQSDFFLSSRHDTYSTSVCNFVQWQMMTNGLDAPLGFQHVVSGSDASIVRSGRSSHLYRERHLGLLKHTWNNHFNWSTLQCTWRCWTPVKWQMLFFRCCWPKLQTSAFWCRFILEELWLISAHWER